MRTILRVALVATVAVVVAGFAKTSSSSRDLTVHEWGTFTSVAGEDGRAVAWLPLDSPADLPCFVERARLVSPKATLTATVRMETPVLYFYAPREATVDVRVGFKRGFITEYFPRATLKPAVVNTAESLLEPGFSSAISWRSVRIQPRAIPAFQTESEPNHYYAARETDAAPLEVGTERERFLFYRGIANFALPLTATVGSGDGIVVRAAGNDEIPSMMLFENRGGRVGYRVHGRLTGEVRLARPEPDGDFDKTRAALQQMLVAQGLFPREASAMVETWRDSWFTEGTRLFYVVPTRTIDEVLPLRIEPAPARVARVFVERLELATEATLSDIRMAAQSNDREKLQEYGRFLRPFVERLLARASSFGDRFELRALLDGATPVPDTGAAACQ